MAMTRDVLAASRNTGPAKVRHHGFHPKCCGRTTDFKRTLALLWFGNDFSSHVDPTARSSFTTPTISVTPQKMALLPELLAVRPRNGHPARLFRPLLPRHTPTVLGRQSYTTGCGGEPRGESSTSAAESVVRKRQASAAGRRRYSSTAVHRIKVGSLEARESQTEGPLVVLGIESSADDSCAAVVDSNGRILSNVVKKQHHQNAQWGGINPLAAQHAHEDNVPIAIGEAMREAGLSLSDLDAIAYTRGPGMRQCLAIGGSSAKALAAVSGKPLYGIHHMQAHVMTCYMTEPSPPAVPFLSLLVSGGHTMIVLVKSLESFEILVDCEDNSIGNAFDRVGRELRLPSDPNRGVGAVLESFAAAARGSPIDIGAIPAPLTKDGLAKRRMSFSFAGLPTKVQEILRTIGFNEDNPDSDQQRHVAKLFQDAAVQHLVDRTALVLDRFKSPADRPTGIVISGGVGCNRHLQKEVESLLRRHKHSQQMKAYYPPASLCTDNAAMIAWTAILRMQGGAQPEPYGLRFRKEWSLEDLYDDLTYDEVDSREPSSTVVS